MSNNILDSIITNLSAADAALAEAKAKVDELRQLAMDELKEQGKTKYKGTFGSVSLVTRKNWDFSNDVIILNEQLKAQKSIEQKTGIATVSSVTESIRVTFS